MPSGECVRFSAPTTKQESTKPSPSTSTTSLCEKPARIEAIIMPFLFAGALQQSPRDSLGFQLRPSADYANNGARSRLKFDPIFGLTRELPWLLPPNSGRAMRYVRDSSARYQMVSLHVQLALSKREISAIILFAHLAGHSFMTPDEREKMHILCQRIAVENDPDNFNKLIRELNELLDGKYARLRPTDKRRTN
jgi:hypothetical protein